MATYKNTTTYNRVDYNTHKFTRVSNMLIEDPRLNISEKGIMLQLLKNSDDYIINMGYEQLVSGTGKIHFNTCIKHLLELGYLQKKRISTGWAWIVSELPIPIA